MDRYLHSPIRLHGIVFKHRYSIYLYLIRLQVEPVVKPSLALECQPTDRKTVSSLDLGFSLTVHVFVGRGLAEELEQFRRKVNWGDGG
jgi:hypothetical protein